MNRGGEQRDQREGDNYTEQRDLEKIKFRVLMDKDFTRKLIRM